MRLQTKLTLAFFVVALAPIAAITTLARVVVEDRYRDEFRRTLDEAEAQAVREEQRLAVEVEQAGERLANLDDRLVGPVVVALARGSLDDDERRALADRAPAVMKTLGLDVLEVVDEHGEILAAGHFVGAAGDFDHDAVARAHRLGGRARWGRADVLEGGRARSLLALTAAREVGFGGGRHARVVVVVGRRVDALMARLPAGARLVAADGSSLAGPREAPPLRLPRRVLELAGPDGQTVARVELVQSDAELRGVLDWIGWAALALGLGGLTLALLVGVLVARRISGPLRELSDGARAVARGAFDASVPVRTRDEVGALAETFNGMTRDLRGAREALVRAERVAAWREIAQRIAHEIKNPLTPIQMAIETLQRAQRRGATQFEELFSESAQTILDEVGRLKHIVSEFSAFARMPQPELGRCDLSELVDGALGLYKNGSTPLTLALDASLPPVLADRDQLTQVVINLVENARDAVAGGGAIRVTTRARAERLELEVADDGPGLSEEARAKLFTPYFTTKARGTGLGLAIVHRIVSDHGGEIHVGNAPGGGAVFTVTLPRADA